jgi:hypothetical protein
LIKRLFLILLIFSLVKVCGFCDPFKDLSPSPDEYNYVQAVSKIKIRGLFQGEIESMAVLEINDGLLRLMRLNDFFKITIDELEYGFTFRKISASGVVLKGRDGKPYNLWINSEIENESK